MNLLIGILAVILLQCLFGLFCYKLGSDYGYKRGRIEANNFLTKSFSDLSPQPCRCDVRFVRERTSEDQAFTISAAVFFAVTMVCVSWST
jgi:hypothetical protein